MNFLDSFLCLFVFCFVETKSRYQSEETQLVTYLDLPLPSDWTFLGQSCPSHMTKSSLWLLVSPCCRHPYRTQYKALSEYSRNSLHVTFPNSGPSWVLCPIAITPASMLIAIYCSVRLCPQQTVLSISENSDCIWLLFLFPGVQHSIWYVADVNRRVCVK